MSVAASDSELVMSRSGKTFYRAARLLPKEVRRQVVELYAFCRRVDNLADDPGITLGERRRALDELAAAFEDKDGLLLRAAGWSFATDGRVAQAARMLVLAAGGDLDQQQPPTEDALLRYAFGVAGTVGIMMAEMLEAAPEGAIAAVALGMAMQLTNIARDVAEDFRMGRVYLPAIRVSATEIANAVDAATARQTVEPNVETAVRRLLTQADALYALALDGVWTLPWRVRWSIVAAALCYREIGVLVGKDVGQSLRQRAVVSNGRKIWLVAVACARLLLPRFWRRRTRSILSTKILGEAVVQQCLQLGVAR